MSECLLTTKPSPSIAQWTVEVEAQKQKQQITVVQTLLSSYNLGSENSETSPTHNSHRNSMSKIWTNK